MNREGVLAALQFYGPSNSMATARRPREGKLVRQASFSRENKKVGLPELVLSGDENLGFFLGAPPLRNPERPTGHPIILWAALLFLRLSLIFIS